MNAVRCRAADRRQERSTRLFWRQCGCVDSRHRFAVREMSWKIDNAPPGLKRNSPPTPKRRSPPDGGQSPRCWVGRARLLAGGILAISGRFPGVGVGKKWPGERVVRVGRDAIPNPRPCSRGTAKKPVPLQLVKDTRRVARNQAIQRLSVLSQ